MSFMPTGKSGRMHRSAGVPPASVPGVPPGVFATLNPVKGRGRVAQLYAALRPQPSTVFTVLTPAEQSAFKKKLDRKFQPIPAIVAKQL